jgi:hypothetical protein
MFLSMRKLLMSVVCLGLTAIPLFAQVSGRITGAVVDPSENVISGAEVTLVNERTSETLNITSNPNGVFVFPNVPPGMYTIAVRFQGFSTYEKTNLILNANQSLALGYIPLAVGTLTEKITVVAEGAQVQTDTSNQTALLSSKQLDGLMSRGRDIVSLMTVLPGVSQNTTQRLAGRQLGHGDAQYAGDAQPLEQRSFWMGSPVPISTC